MKSYLHQLQTNEAILLMYLADELPAHERAEVEQMVAADAALARELENLRQAHELAMNSLRSLDAATRPAVPEAMALRDVSRLIQEWSDRQAQAEPEAPLVIHRPMPWRRIGIAAAAAVLVGYYVWAVYQPMKVPQDNRMVQEDYDPYGPGVPDTPPPPRELTDQEKLAQLSNSLDDSMSDDASNLHVAEVASIIPPGNDSDQNAGEP